MWEQANNFVFTCHFAKSLPVVLSPITISNTNYMDVWTKGILLRKKCREVRAWEQFRADPKLMIRANNVHVNGESLCVLASNRRERRLRCINNYWFLTWKLFPLFMCALMCIFQFLPSLLLLPGLADQTNKHTHTKKERSDCTNWKKGCQCFWCKFYGDELQIFTSTYRLFSVVSRNAEAATERWCRLCESTMRYASHVQFPLSHPQKSHFMGRKVERASIKGNCKFFVKVIFYGDAMKTE